MSRWETYQVGNTVRLRQVGAKREAPKAPAPVAQPEPVDYEALKKDELVALAEERGVDASGTKAEIAQRLEQADG